MLGLQCGLPTNARFRLSCGLLNPASVPQKVTSSMSTAFQYQDIAKMIDHSILQPNTTVDDLEAGIDLAIAYDVASVCLMPYYLKRCAERLAGTTVIPSCTIGFPHGGHTSAMKVAESKMAIADGGQELDMVVNISKVISGDWRYVTEDIRGVIDAAHQAGVKVKVIFENCYLNEDQKKKLCEICGELNADWVKTSTGYGSHGATIEDLLLMRQHTPAHVQVKAAGGIRDLDMLIQVRGMGVTRCGSSRTKPLLDECRLRLGMEPLQVKASAVSNY